MRIRLGVGSAGPAVPPRPRLVGYLPMSARATAAQRGGNAKAAGQIAATLGLVAPNALAPTLAMGASARARLRLSATLATAAFATASVRSTSGLTATLATSASAKGTSGSGARLSATLATSASAKGNGTAGSRIAALLATGASARGTSRTAGRITATLATGASARGTVGGGSGFLNGHAYRRLMLVSPQPDLTDEAVLTDFPLFVDSTEIPGDWSWLVVANGKLKSVAGAVAAATPAVNPYTLANPPGYATNWSLLKATASPTITQSATGVTLAGGTAGDETVNNIAIIAKTKPASTWSVRFTTMKTDANQAVAGTTIFMLFYAGLVGDGTAGFPADVSTWAGSTEPYSHTFRDHCNAVRLSLYFQNTANQSETQNVYVAPLIATTAAPVGVPSDAGSADSFPMLRNVSYDWVVAFDGTALTVTQTDPSGTVRANSYTDATLAAKAAAAGSFGLQCDGGRTVQVTGFAPVAAAGTAYDIRFHAFDGTAAGGPEQVGAQLDHDYESFDGSAGTLRAFVRLRSLTVASGAKLWVYYGKAGLAASEENVAGTWTGATMVIDPTTGADLTGRGRTFAKAGTGTITSTTLDGRPAASTIDQAAVAMRRTNSDLSVFDGLPAVTEELWAKVGTASSGNGAREGGDISDASQTYQRARFSWWVEHLGSTSGTAADVIQVGAQWWGSDNKYHNESTESRAGIADGSTARHLMIVHQSNQHSLAYDGETDINTTNYANAPSVGTIHTQSYDNYSLFAGTGTQNTAPAMTMGLYAVWPFAFSATRRGLADRTQRDSGSVVSIGAEDAFGDADRSPVAGVFRRTVTATVDIDVLAAPTFDPDAGDHLTLTGIVPASTANAAYSILAGKVHVVPNPGVAPTPGVPAANVDEPVYTVSDGVKTAKAKLVLPIGGVIVVGGNPWEDDLTQWATIPALASWTGAKVTVNTIADLPSTLAGNTAYVVSSNISATATNKTVTGGGSKSGPTLIVGNNTIPANYRGFRLNSLTINNASHVYFQYLDFNDTQVTLQGTTDHVSFERFFAYGRTGGVENSSFIFDAGSTMRYMRFRYFQYGKPGVTTTTNMFRQHQQPIHNLTAFTSACPQHTWIYRGRFTNVTDPGPFVCIVGMWGDGPRDYWAKLDLNIYSNLIDTCNITVIAEIKTSGATVADNTYERGSAGAAAYWRNRHSNNDYIGNLFVQKTGAGGGGGKGGVTQRGFGSFTLNNHAYTLDDGVQPTLASPAGAAGDAVTLFRGFGDVTMFPFNNGDPPTNYGDMIQGHTEMNSDSCHYGGNNMGILIGVTNSADTGGLPPNEQNIPACFNIVRPVTGAGNERNRSITVTSDSDWFGRGKFRLASTGTPAYVGPPAFGTLKAGHTTDYGTTIASKSPPVAADITAVPHRWLSSEVGPGAPVAP